MDLSKLPKPIVYSLSLVLLAIGLGITYQVVLGSNLSYDGPLGSIKVGSGENQTTLSQFLNESQTALDDAKTTIDEQDQIIDRLKDSVARYKREVAALKTLATKLRTASDTASRRAVSSDISRTIASINVSENQLAKLNVSASKAKTLERLKSQAILTKDVKQTISKTRTDAVRQK